MSALLRAHSDLQLACTRLTRWIRVCAENAKKRAVKAVLKSIKDTFHDGLESWVRRLRFDDRSGGPDVGGGLGGSSDRALVA